MIPRGWTRKPEQRHVVLGQQPDVEPRSSREFHFGRPRWWVFSHNRQNCTLAGGRGPRADIRSMKSLNLASGFLLLSWSSWAPSCPKKGRMSIDSYSNWGWLKLHRVGHESRWHASMPTWAPGGEHRDSSPRSRSVGKISAQSFGVCGC